MSFKIEQKKNVHKAWPIANYTDIAIKQSFDEKHYVEKECKIESKSRI